MTTTTIRVDSDTHRTLLDLSAASGDSLIDTVRHAAEALRRERFGHQVADEMAALRRDRAAWADYLSEADAISTADGIR